MYWERIFAKVYRLRAELMAEAGVLSGTRPTATIAELRARADDIDPGEDQPFPDEDRPVTASEWLRGIRQIDGETPLAAEWEQPLGAHDAVRLGAFRSHNGTNWRSLIDYNTTEPAEGQFWTEDDPTLDGEPGPGLTITPWEAGISVVVDDSIRYSYDGRIYRVIQAHTTQAGWTPNVVPALFADEGPAP